MDWVPHRGVKANRSTIEAVYGYYGGLFLGDPRFEWAGMADLIGASFYGGFLDIAAAPFRLLRYYETTFLRMQKKIFEDQAVMHEAYLAGGMAEIEMLHGAGTIDSATVRAWQAIDGSDGAGWREGNRWLLYREQDDILDHFYVSMHSRHGPEGALLTYLLTLLGTPSVPDANGYPAVFPLTLAGGPLRLRTPFADGNIAVFSDRWELIEHDTLPAYRRLIASPTSAQALMRTPIAKRVPAFRLANHVSAILSALLARWSVRASSSFKIGVDRARADSAPGRGTVVLDLPRERDRRGAGAAVRAWANPRHQPFPIEVRLAGDRRYAGQAQLVKLYRPMLASSPMRATVKLPAASLETAERTLRQLAGDWSLDEDAITTWREEAGRPTDLNHHYSTRVFTAEPVDFVEIEIQVEHHVAEDQFIVDVLFSIAPLD
ncbi:MAG TPA: hypothetical protein VES97_01465 [Solirubrobacteraceae bacterium]|nr:hypothetical protein [Solirubrobacteraceae bacterium]